METIYAFNLYRDAAQCGFHLQKGIAKLNEQMSPKKIRFETTIVLNAGEPVTHNREFFGESITLARRMSHLGKDGDIIISSCINDHYRQDYDPNKNSSKVKVTGVNDERFINRIMDVLDSRIHDENFNVITLTEQVGISRPQLYRRIHSLYGISPNQLINELRLKEAIKLLRNKFGNVSEIAFQVGYNNPSYFAKCFKNRFGILPSKYTCLSV
jgi:AraC-like DNA-binding protein